MRGYGVKNFNFEKLITCRNRLECDLYEAKYIEEYDSCENGYNPNKGNNEDDLAYFRLLGGDLDAAIDILARMQFGRYRLADFDKPVRDMIYLICESETLQKLTNIGIMLVSELNERYFYVFDRRRYDEEAVE
jgi:hypothetical protein